MDELTVRIGERELGVADWGGPGVPLLWCHGGPGSRLEAAVLADAAAAAGLRLVGVDRPGYGASTPQPGRSIADGARDLLAVADHLGLERVVLVGVSTGGAFALATAAIAPDRVIGVVPCAAMTDMRYEPARSTMSRPHALAVWDAPDREAAKEAALASHGIDGRRIVSSAEGPPLPASDLALLRDAAWARAEMANLAEAFLRGVEGYVDDRFADRPGWVSFDVSAVRCPVTIVHGQADVICQPVHAEHTAALVPHAELRLFDDLGHFSVVAKAIPAAAELART